MSRDVPSRNTTLTDDEAGSSRHGLMLRTFSNGKLDVRFLTMDMLLRAPVEVKMAALEPTLEAVALVQGTHLSCKALLPVVPWALSASHIAPSPARCFRQARDKPPTQSGPLVGEQVATSVRVHDARRQAVYCCLVGRCALG